MLKIQKTFLDCCLLTLLLTTLLLLLSSSVTGQELTSSQDDHAEVASKNKRAEMKQPGRTAITNSPVYKDFMGVTLGMGADEVRAKLGHLKVKGERQDFFVFSESQSAQVVYDDQGKVVVISVDYVSKDGNAPSPESVLGEVLQAKQDGSMYQMKRYAEAGYWVAYNRTAGDDAIVTVTMQRM